jgi:polyphosphate kinase
VARAAAHDAGTRYLNRELAWLDFNARILDLAADASVPLLERVKFCSIFSAHLDEFFSVRVAGLEGQMSAGVPVRSPDGRTPQEALTQIRERVVELVARQARLWSRELRPALEREGIVVGGIEDLSAKELQELTTRFTREIYPVLTPLAVSPGQPFPYISPLSLSLGVFVRDPETGEERFARVKVPEAMPRFLLVGRNGLYLPLERLISHFLSALFPQMEIVERAVFRVTRDSDFEVSDEADDLLEAVELELRRRRFGDVVRVEVSSQMSDAMVDRLRSGLDVEPRQVYQVPGKLDLADLWQLVKIARPDLLDEPWVGTTPPRFAVGAANGDLFQEIRRGDVLVHHPYESFTTTFEAFVRSAAKDPDVIGLKTTVYRTSDESPLVPALIEAAEDGKQSVCLVELKARFDERRNIEWSRKLERAGVHVVFGFPQLKIHLKATLVVRREADTLRRYVHIGTGNYHALNARTYEDFGVFTADDDVASDVADLFNHLTGFGRPVEFRKLLVAPYNLRSRLLEEIASVRDTAAAGRPARIRIKVNALTDPPLIDALYEASQAGAEIELVVRSICSLRPGVKGLSENIRVRSVLGRFLEHSRVYHFDRDGSSSWFLGSADLMPRNLDNRLELVVPVENERLRSRLDSVFHTLLVDNTDAWELGQDGSWKRLRPAKGERPRGTHTVLMRTASRAPRRPPVSKRR